MKVGDLVTLKMKKTQPLQEPHRAIITDKYTDQDGFVRLEVVWMTPMTAVMPYRSILRPEHFEVISESR